MISVAMCTYNGVNYLAEQLDSIVNQTVQPDEIIICDDGSIDDTVKVAKTILKRWNGIFKIIINETNLGFIKNFEKAISLCQGDIIFLSDQDDVWDRKKIEIMMDVFNTYPEAYMAFHDAEIVDKNLNLLFPSFWRSTLRFKYVDFLNHDYRKLYECNVVQGSACAFKREIFEKARPFIQGAYHDEWLAIVALASGDIIPISDTLMKYRQDNNTLGGMPLSISNKIAILIKETSKKYNLDLKEIKRRIRLLENFNIRYLNNNIAYPLDVTNYLVFLKIRCSYLEKLDLKLAFKIVKYLYFYPKLSRDINLYIKDLFEIFMCRKRHKV